MPPSSTLDRVRSAPTTDLFGLATDILAETVRTVAFWTAIALPFLYLPLLFTGSGSPDTLATVTALVVVNVAALVVGHGYGGSDAGEN